VDEVCNPSIAKKLKSYGFSYVRDNLPIIDSYFPPDFCRSFTPDKKRMRSGDVIWPNRKKAALIRILRKKGWEEKIYKGTWRRRKMAVIIYYNIDASYRYRIRRLIWRMGFSRSPMSLERIDANYEWVCNF